MIKHPALDTLNIGFNHISKEGAISFSKMMLNDYNLRWVSLSIVDAIIGNNKIGTEGIMAILNSIINHPCLKSIDLCKVLY